MPSVFISNEDDFISPSQACINPLFTATPSSSSSNNKNKNETKNSSSSSSQGEITTTTTTGSSKIGTKGMVMNRRRRKRTPLSISPKSVVAMATTNTTSSTVASSSSSSSNGDNNFGLLSLPTVNTLPPSPITDTTTTTTTTTSTSTSSVVGVNKTVSRTIPSGVKKRPALAYHIENHDASKTIALNNTILPSSPLSSSLPLPPTPTINDNKNKPITKKKATISIADCLACSGCVTSSEAVLITTQHSVAALIQKCAKEREEKKIVFTISPVAIADLTRVLYPTTTTTATTTPSTVEVYRKLATFLQRKFHASTVIDGSVPQRISLMESALEFCHRYRYVHGTPPPPSSSASPPSASPLSASSRMAMGVDCELDLNYQQKRKKQQHTAMDLDSDLTTTNDFNKQNDTSSVVVVSDNDNDNHIHNHNTSNAWNGIRIRKQTEKKKLDDENINLSTPSIALSATETRYLIRRPIQTPSSQQSSNLYKFQKDQQEEDTLDGVEVKHTAGIDPRLHFVHESSSSPSVTEARRVISRRGNNRKDDTDDNEARVLPMLASSCPGFVCYVEKTSPKLIPYLCTVKSPMAIAGSIIKHGIMVPPSVPPPSSEILVRRKSKKLTIGNVNHRLPSSLPSSFNMVSSDSPTNYNTTRTTSLFSSSLSKDNSTTQDEFFHVAIMPCHDKKLEAGRKDLAWERQLLRPRQYNNNDDGTTNIDKDSSTAAVVDIVPDIDLVITTNELVSVLVDVAMQSDNKKTTCCDDDGDYIMEEPNNDDNIRVGDDNDPIKNCTPSTGLTNEERKLKLNIEKVRTYFDELPLAPMKPFDKNTNNDDDDGMEDRATTTDNDDVFFATTKDAIIKNYNSSNKHNISMTEQPHTIPDNSPSSSPTLSPSSPLLSKGFGIGSGGYAEFIFRYACFALFGVSIAPNEALPWRRVTGNGGGSSSATASTKMGGGNGVVRRRRRMRPGAASNNGTIPEVVATYDFCEVVLYRLAGSGDYSLRRSSSSVPPQGTGEGWTSSYDEDEVVLKFAIAYGFKNVQLVQQKLLIKKGSCGPRDPTTASDNDRDRYHYVEMMACPSGCLNGGGQIKDESFVDMSLPNTSADDGNTAASPDKRNKKETPAERRARVTTNLNLMGKSWLHDDNGAIYTTKEDDIGHDESAIRDKELLHTRFHVVPKLELTTGATAGVALDDTQW